MALSSQGHYPLRLLAEEIVRDIPSKDYLSEALAVYYWVLSHTRYSRDPRTKELVRSPSVIVDAMVAGQMPSLDCDDMTALIAALLLSLGNQVRIVTVAFRRAFYKGALQYSHVYLQAHEPRSGGWITLDPVAAEKTGEMLSRARAIKYWPIA